MLANIVPFFIHARNGLLGVLELSEKERDTQQTNSWVQILFLLISLFQMLSFVTMDLPSGSSWPLSMSPAEVVSSLTSVRGYTRWVSPGALTGAIWVGTIWVGVLILLLAWGVYMFAKNRIAYLWPLRVLRFMGRISAGILFIPLLQMLLQSSCARLQGVAECSEFGVASQIAVSVVFSFFLLLVSFLFSGVFFDTLMTSRNLSAAPHGRVQVLLLGIQVILVLTTSTFQVADTVLRLVILAACGLVWLGSNLYFLPFHAHTTNRLAISGALTYLLACACLVINVFAHNADAGVMFWVAFPLAVGSGIALADARANSVWCTLPERLNTPYEVDIMGRLMLHKAMYGHPFLIAQQSSLGLAPGQFSGDSGEGAHAAAAALQLPQPPSAGQARGQQLQGQHYDGVSGMQGRISPGDLAAILALYRGALPRFSGSAIYHVFCSRIYGDLMGNRHMQMSHLLQAERSSPPFDVRSPSPSTHKDDPFPPPPLFSAAQSPPVLTFLSALCTQTLAPPPHTHTHTNLLAGQVHGVPHSAYPRGEQQGQPRRHLCNVPRGV